MHVFYHEIIFLMVAKNSEIELFENINQPKL